MADDEIPFVAIGAGEDPPWPPDECIEVATYRNRKGYGNSGITIGPKASYGILAHRVAYEMTYGPATGMFVLHTCDNPPCVNPLHLWLGTAKDNTADMIRKGRGVVQAPFAVCMYGHEFTPESTIIRKDGRQRCRLCKNEWQRKNRKSRAKKVATNG